MGDEIIQPGVVVQAVDANLAAKKLEITTLLDIIAAEDTISDLHISTGDFVAYRVNGDIVKQEQFGKINSEFMELFLKHLMQSD